MLSLLPNPSTFQPCVFLLNLIIVSLNVPHTAKFRIAGVAAWRPVCYCMNLCSCQIEKSRAAASISYNKETQPNNAQYWCSPPPPPPTLFHSFLAYLCGKTSIFNLDKLNVDVLSCLNTLKKGAAFKFR